MALPTVTLNETTPAGGAYVRDGNDRIIEYKIQVREILAIDHYFPLSGQNDACGRHKWVSLIEAADVDATATAPVLGAETADGKPELTYVGEDGSIQVTKGGKVNTAALDATLSAWAVFMALIYPVGSIYINAAVATNPATLLGFGTWAAFGAGKVMVGLNAAETEFDVLGETGGEKTHTLSTAEMPVHTHTYDYSTGAGGASTVIYKPVGNTIVGSSSVDNTGSGSGHNNLQPYIVVYMWKRTA